MIIFLTGVNGKYTVVFASISNETPRMNGGGEEGKKEKSGRDGEWGSGRWEEGRTGGRDEMSL